MCLEYPQDNFNDNNGMYRNHNQLKFAVYILAVAYGGILLFLFALIVGVIEI